MGRVGVASARRVSSRGYSLLADHFKANRRSSIIGIVMLGSPLGFWWDRRWVDGPLGMELARGVPGDGCAGLLVALLVFAT